ncbi:hypothetical protein COV21_01935 [Candidatus Woesearchaeota archaeon CG10_big_fil_rev_8_21_14_0_10_45_5]|nr:MAG: hypothetical protein COV21_01935 [Candidatus Woesearchaeota archaeon CG10_big_fil_rev_8_21_14_0_10_45_5]PIU30310.1 MAG: hypothetical protein COT07_01375 [Candidatus Woesearchaeota archaeon CG07_land_8_20_14_0_80_44_23]
MEDKKFDFSFRYVTSLSYEMGSRFAEVSEIILITAASFLVPFLIGHPQLIVGIAVNVLLIESALHIKDYKLAAPIILPSIGALSRAALFGGLTKYLVFMLPFIWVGNSILVFAVKALNLFMKKNFLLSGFSGVILKSGFLFASAYLLFRFGLVPKLFLSAFGFSQVITGAAAVLIVYPAFLLKRKLNGKEKKIKRK